MKNPTILFTGPQTAYLLLDVSGLTMEDAMAGNSDNVLTFDQVSFVELDLSDGTVEISEDGAVITATDVPSAITSQGYEAFPNYEAGTEFDPVSFTITTDAACKTAVTDEPLDEATGGDSVGSPGGSTDLPWLWWTGGGLLAAAGGAGLLVPYLRRRNRVVGGERRPCAHGPGVSPSVCSWWTCWCWPDVQPALTERREPGPRRLGPRCRSWRSSTPRVPTRGRPRP